MLELISSRKWFKTDYILMIALLTLVELHVLLSSSNCNLKEKKAS